MRVSLSSSLIAPRPLFLKPPSDDSTLSIRTWTYLPYLSVSVLYFGSPEKLTFFYRDDDDPAVPMNLLLALFGSMVLGGLLP